MIQEQDTWTAMVRPLLWGIRTNASWVKHHAKEIEDKVSLLPYAPNFETEAIAEINDAIKELADARGKLENAKNTYLRKPVQS